MGAGFRAGPDLAAGGGMVHPSPELIARFDCRGPRYTSYPTAAVFDDTFPAAAYRRALRELGKDERDVSVYVHLPFCRQRCHYCACNVIVTNSPPRADVYLDRLERELSLVCDAIGTRVGATQLHLGGGTPTFLSVAQIARLLDLLEPRFDWSRCAERAVEVDPRVTSVEQLELLAGRGFNRISLGVQDFDPTVQTAIGREQSVELTGEVVAQARRLGFAGVNLDLVYGLPHQTPASLAVTLEAVVALRPDRIALYGYAHLPL